MARTDFDIPSLGGKFISEGKNLFINLRDSLPGDSYNWSWIRDLSEVNYLAIHASGGPDTQTPEEIANYHIRNNGWGGIGYHFLIAKDGTVYYVGDIQTARANIANLNEQVIGICLIGNFTGASQPSAEQLDSAHKLCDFFISDYPQLPNIKSWDTVYGHKELPGQSTECPGDNWAQVKPKIISVDISTRGGNIVFNKPTLETTGQQDQIESLQMSLAYVNSQLISCQEALQQAEEKLNQPKPKTETTITYKTIKPYLPLLLIVLSAVLTFSINLNLLGLLLGIQTNVFFLDLIFSAFLIAWIFIYLKNFVRKFLDSK